MYIIHLLSHNTLGNQYSLQCVRTKALRLLLLLWCEDNVVNQLQLGMGIAFDWREIHHEIILDGKDGVAGEIRVVGGEDLSSDWDMIVVGNLESQLLVVQCAVFRLNLP